MPPRRGRRAQSPPVIYDGYSSDSIQEFIDDEEDGSDSTASTTSSDDSNDIGVAGREEEDEDLEYTLTSENGANVVEANVDLHDSGNPESSGSSPAPIYVTPPPVDVIINNELQPGPSRMPSGGRRRSSVAVRGRINTAGASGCTEEVPTKIPKLDVNVDASPPMFTEDSNNCCPICFDDYTQTGEHRLVCLKCGHIFGKSCIERWIKVEKNNKCPTCKVAAKAADIRCVYGNFSSGDSGDSIQLRGQVKILQDENILLLGDKERIEKQLLDAKQEIEDLHVLYKIPAADVTFELTIKKLGSGYVVSAAKIKTGRSFGFSPDGNFVVTSCELSALGSKPHGLQKISLNGASHEKVPAHKQPVRCIRVCPFNSNFVASISDADKELNIYESKQDKALELRQLYKLDHPTWAFCWESERKIVIGSRNGMLQRFTLGTKNLEELVGKTNEPILDIFYNRCHEVFFYGTVKGVYAYRAGVTELIKARVQSFYYDVASNCFLLTIPPGDGSPIKLQLFQVQTRNEIKAVMIREYVSTAMTTSSTTANIFWLAPTGHIVCAFFDEPRNITRIFNWDKLDAPNPLEIEAKNERRFPVAGDAEAVSQYAYFNRTTQPSPLAPNGVQNVFAVLTRSKLHTYCLQYEKQATN